MSKLTNEHLRRKAIVYVRQSTATQLAENHESRRRQYALADEARQMGFSEVEIIDDDLGVSSSGLKERPGFDRLVNEVCSGDVGAVFSIETSRLSRNGRDWHRLLEFCAVTQTLLIEPQGIFDPRQGSDRLVLGLQGAMSEYELTLLRQRSQAALRSKASRGELQFQQPVGLVWTHDGRIELVPDTRVQQAIHTVFDKFAELGSARQVLLWHRDNEVLVPANTMGEFGREIAWKQPSYGTIKSFLDNPAYAGAYAWGKTTNRTTVVGGRARKTRGHHVPREQWHTLLLEHHPGYISWQRYLQNQQILAENAHMKSGGRRKSGRGGRGLLTGKLRCRRCGRMLSTTYSGRHASPRYQCTGAYRYEGGGLCVAFGGVRVDAAVSRQVLQIAEPEALQAARTAHSRLEAADTAQLKALQLELEEASYAVRIARRRYDAVDPDNRLVAGELEQSWEAALQRESELRRRIRITEQEIAARSTPSLEHLESLSRNLPKIWNDPRTDMKLKQRIVGVLVREIVVDVDEDACEIVLVIHWVGGRHSELRVRKNRSGRNSLATGPKAEAVIGAMVGQFTDVEIANTLNRLRLRTGKGNTWTESRVRSFRAYRSLPAFDPDARDTSTVTMSEAAELLGVSPTAIRTMIKHGTIDAEQVIKGAPWQIDADSLRSTAVQEAVSRGKSGETAPRTAPAEQETLGITDL